MDTAPLVFRVNSKDITLPADPSRLPGLSPDAVDVVLSVIGKHAVDPKTVDIVAANLAGARFGVEISTYTLAETLRRLDRGDDVAPYLAAVRRDHEFEVVAAAFALIVERNPSVFGKKKAGDAPAVPAGN